MELAATGTLTQPGSLGSTASNYPCGPHRMLSKKLDWRVYANDQHQAIVVKPRTPTPNPNDAA